MLRRSKNKRKGGAAEPASGAEPIVVVGDDADARELLARVLQRAGHETEQVNSGDAAIEAVTEAPRLAIVALLRETRSTDMVKSLRASDDEVVAALPVIVVTDDDRSSNSAAKAGADGTLTRPFHADELTNELSSVLARSPEERVEIRAGAALRHDD